jgi:hypothetical protein
VENQAYDYFAEAYRALRVANAMLTDGQADPSTGLKNMGKVQALVQMAVAKLCDPKGGKKILRVPNLTAITLPGGSTQPVDGNGVSVQWPKEGYVLGIRVGTTDGLDTTAAGASVKIIIQDGEQNLFTDGDKDAYAIFTSINTVASPYWPLWVPVQAQERWNLTPRAEVTGAVGNATFTPWVSFAYANGETVNGLLRRIAAGQTNPLTGV